MTSFSVPALAPLLEASPTILRLAIPRLAPVVATALVPELAIPLLVVGTSYAAFQALHYWSKAQNDAIQAKAQERYCALNSGDPDCAAAPTFTGGQSLGVSYKINMEAGYKEDTRYKIDHFPQYYSGPVIGVKTTKELEYKNGSDFSYRYTFVLQVGNPVQEIPQFNTSWGSYEQVRGFAEPYVRVLSVSRTDGQPDTGVQQNQNNFSQWQPAKQQTALQQLTDNDWKEAISSTSVRQLHEGETINQPVILTGNPSSVVPQERVPNVINFPGTVPAVAANDGIYIPANQENTAGFSIPSVQNIPNINQGESTRIQTQTGYIEISPTGKVTIVGSPSAPLPKTAAPPNVGSADIWGELQDIKGLIGLLPLAGAAVIAPAITRVPNLSQVGSAAETATCNIVSGKSPCNGNPLPRINNKLDDLITGLGLAGQAGQGGLLQAIYNTVTTINSKMGGELVGGLSGAITRTSSFLGVDRLMNLVTTIVVLHNAAMLSSALKDTLLSMVSSVGKASGLLVDAEGNAVDTNALFNQGVETFLKTLLGTEVYENTKQTFNRANRFYQASANIVNSFQSAINGVQAIVERGAEYTGKIGNALKRFGMVGENAYSWMSENMNTKTAWLDRLQSRINQTTEVISGVDDIAQNVISVQDSVKQLATEKQEFDKALKDLTPNKPADNSVVASQVKLDKDASQAPATTFADIP